MKVITAVVLVCHTHITVGLKEFVTMWAGPDRLRPGSCGVALEAVRGMPPEQQTLVLVLRLRCSGCRRRLLRLGLLLLLVELLDGLDLLLELHPPVLEPDLDLSLCEAQGVRHLDPPSPRQVVVRVELLLQLQRLVARVRLSPSPPESVRACYGHPGVEGMV